jgi:hypothetical protein
LFYSSTCRRTKIGKKTVVIDAVIGAPWGSKFEVKKGKLEKCLRRPELIMQDLGMSQYITLINLQAIKLHSTVLRYYGSYFI